MKRIETDVSLSAHPDAPQQWVLTPVAARQAAEHVVGKPVTLNFGPDKVGQVVAAVVDLPAGVIHATLEVDDAVSAIVERQEQGLALENPEAPPNFGAGAGEFELDSKWLVTKVGSVERSRREPETDGPVDFDEMAHRG